MRRPTLHLLTLAACSIIVLASPLDAQEDANVARGFAPDKVYDFGGIDHVNLFNGNLTLTLPIGPRFPVSTGFSYGLTLTYNSNVWDLDSRNDPQHPGPDDQYLRARPNRFSNAGMGWSLSLGQLYPPLHPLNPESEAWLYVGEDGGHHHLYDTLHVGESPTAAGTLDHWFSRDGTYLRMRQVSAGAIYDVEYPDGTVRRFRRTAGEHESYTLEHLRDGFAEEIPQGSESYDGNVVRVTHDADGWTVDDGFRTHRVDTAVVANTRVVTAVRLASFGSRC